MTERSPSPSTPLWVPILFEAISAPAGAVTLQPAGLVLQFRAGRLVGATGRALLAFGQGDLEKDIGRAVGPAKGFEQILALVRLELLHCLDEQLASDVASAGPASLLDGPAMEIPLSISELFDEALERRRPPKTVAASMAHRLECRVVAHEGPHDLGPLALRVVRLVKGCENLRELALLFGRGDVARTAEFWSIVDRLQHRGVLEIEVGKEGPEEVLLDDLIPRLQRTPVTRSAPKRRRVKARPAEVSDDELLEMPADEDEEDAVGLADADDELMEMPGWDDDDDEDEGDPEAWRQEPFDMAGIDFPLPDGSEHHDPEDPFGLHVAALMRRVRAVGARFGR